MRSTFKSLATKLPVVVVVIGCLIWAVAGFGSAVPEDGRPRQIRVVYAVPADTAEDASAIAAIRRDVDVTQDWLASQTNGRSLRVGRRDGAVAVDVNHLTVTAEELRGRPDAAAIVNDEFLTGSGEQPDELMLIFVPVQFSDLVRCGEGSRAGFAIIWMGSCGATPSESTVAFGQGTTFVIAHELIHALGAVQPCAPHYGNNGHVTDDPADLLYDGPNRSAAVQLDPGHDDYYATGNARCPDIATHPAWQKHV